MRNIFMQISLILKRLAAQETKAAAQMQKGGYIVNNLNRLGCRSLSTAHRSMTSHFLFHKHTVEWRHTSGCTSAPLNDVHSDSKSVTPHASSHTFCCGHKQVDI